MPNNLSREPVQGVDDLYYLEKACEILVKARSMGSELNIISDRASKAFMDDFVANGMVRAPPYKVLSFYGLPPDA